MYNNAQQLYSIYFLKNVVRLGNYFFSFLHLLRRELRSVRWMLLMRAGWGVGRDPGTTIRGLAQDSAKRDRPREILPLPPFYLKEGHLLLLLLLLAPFLGSPVVPVSSLSIIFSQDMREMDGRGRRSLRPTTTLTRSAPLPESGVVLLVRSCSFGRPRVLRGNFASIRAEKKIDSKFPHSYKKRGILRRLKIQTVGKYLRLGLFRCCWIRLRYDRNKLFVFVLLTEANSISHHNSSRPQ